MTRPFFIVTLLALTALPGCNPVSDLNLFGPFEPLPTGRLQISTDVSGDSAPDSLFFAFTLTSNPFMSSVTFPDTIKVFGVLANTEHLVQRSLAVGDWQVEIGGGAVFCEPFGPAQRLVTIDRADTASVSYSVICEG